MANQIGKSITVYANANQVTVLVHTPAFIQDEQHVAMISVQAKLLPRLRKYLSTNIDLVSVLIIDFCAPEHRVAMNAVATEFDVVKWSIPAEHGTEWGIRKGTNYAATAVADEVRATHLLRVIQDTFVFDPLAMAKYIEEAVATDGDWIGASVHHWPTSSHFGLCHQMGLDCELELRYSNGALMLAPISTWRNWYVSMPANINHYFDDVIMSETFRQKGTGRQFDWQPCWAHRHGLDAETGFRTATAHGLAIRMTKTPYQARLPKAKTPRLGICAFLFDETSDLREWIEFHRLVGVERFWLYVDESGMSGVRNQIAALGYEEVSVISWPGHDHSAILAAYNHCTSTFKESADWIAVIDVNEFLYSPTGISLPEILVKYEDNSSHGGVFVTCLHFAEQGSKQGFDAVTIERRTFRGIAGDPNSRGRLIVRVTLQPNFSSSTSAVSYSGNGLTINEHRSWVESDQSTPPSIDLLRINLYGIAPQRQAAFKASLSNNNVPGSQEAADSLSSESIKIQDLTILQFLPELQRQRALRR